LFRQPLAWFVLALGSGMMAFYYLWLIVRYLEQTAELRAAGVSVEIVMRYFSTTTFGLMLLTPVLTMNAIAADKRDGVLRFLYSTPVSSTAIVLGKLLGLMSLSIVLVMLVAVMPLTLFWGAPIDAGVYASNVLGIVLFALLHNCLGLMASALTRAPVVSALTALLLSLSLWLAEWANSIEPQTSLLGGWSTLTRMRGFNQGLLLSSDAAYFLVASLVCVAITVVLVEYDRRAT